MSFRVLVNISVVNEEGEEVDKKGNIGIVGRHFKPLEIKQEFFEYDDVESALATLNALGKTIQAIGEVA